MISNHVTSQSLSKRLYEKGVRVESEFSWVCRRARKYGNELDKWFLLETTRGCFYKKGNIYPALLSSEIGELLPSEIDTEDNIYYYRSFFNKHIGYFDDLNNSLHALSKRTEAEARGLILEYLIDNELIEL